MKVLVSIVLLAAAVIAEPPRYQQQRQYYFARQQQDDTGAAPYAASGWRPRGPAFDLPQRQYGALNAPQQQYGAPNALEQQFGAPSAPQQQYGSPSAVQQQYGAPNAPQQQYGGPNAPQQQYGAPNVPPRQYGVPTGPQRKYGIPEESETTTETNEEEEEVSTVRSIAESESEPVNAANELEDEGREEKQQPQQTGEYYVALPDGRLQRVSYVSRQDIEAMKYFAKIRAENVEPLRGPIYAYAPLQKIQIVPGDLQQVSVASAPANAKPQKLEIEPVGAQVQYQYDSPLTVVPLANPLNNAYTAYTTNYRAPAASDSRYFLTFQ